MDKLSIHNEMARFDKKDRDFYQSLTDEERKKFSNYLMIRWGSAVQGSQELQEFYVISTNERLNKHFFSVNRHPHLQWLMATSVSPGLGTQRHQWIAPKKKDASNNEIKKGRRKSKLSAKVPTLFRSFNPVVARVEHQLPRGIGKIFARKVCTLFPRALLGFAKHGIPCQIQVKLACVCFLVHNQIIPYKTARFCYGGCGSDGGGETRRNEQPESGI